MELRPIRFDRAAPIAPALAWAVLLAVTAARQAASRTAAAQARLERPRAAPGRFTPQDGRFSAETARTVAGWRDG